MKFVEVKDDPRLKPVGSYRYKYRHDLQGFLDRFMASGVKFAKVEYTPQDYGDSSRACTSIYAAAKKSGYPIETLVRDSTVYLVRTDI